MDNLSIGAGDAVLVLGATGFIGSRLIPELPFKLEITDCSDGFTDRTGKGK